jgi:hypothetical protein
VRPEALLPPALSAHALVIAPLQVVMPEDLKDIDARLHALQQFLKQVSDVQRPASCSFDVSSRLSRSRAWGGSKSRFLTVNRVRLGCLPPQQEEHAII